MKVIEANKEGRLGTLVSQGKKKQAPLSCMMDIYKSLDELL